KTYDYLASLSPIIYNNSDYNQINPLFIDADNGVVAVNADDQDVSTVVFGNNDINCFAFNMTVDVGLGTGRLFVCRHLDSTYSCEYLEHTLAGGIGSCDCDNGITWAQNGAGNNYTWQNETQCNFAIISGSTDPPYLRANETTSTAFRTGNNTLYLNGSTLVGDGEDIGIKVLNNNNTIKDMILQDWGLGILLDIGSENTIDSVNFIDSLFSGKGIDILTDNNIINNSVFEIAYHPLNITGTGNNITRNTFFDPSEVTESILLNNSGNNIWLNNFYFRSISSNSTNTYCVGEEGNFYEESITPMVGDCGQANMTYPGSVTFNPGRSFVANWTKQSSLKTVTYEIYSNRTGNTSRIFMGNTTALNMTIALSAFTLGSGNYSLWGIPYVNGSRINGTWIKGENFTINAAPVISSVLLNATSADNLTTDNLTANPGAASDPDADNVELNYNWYRNGVSDTILNMPMTAPDRNNKTYDLSGNNYHGTNTNATWNPTGGHNGFGAYSFNGTTAYIKTTYIANIPQNQSRAVSVWIKPGTNNWGVVYAPVKGNVGNLGYFGTYNRLDSRLCTGTNASKFVNFYPTYDSWQHVVSVYDDSTKMLSLYVNGTLADTNNLTGIPCDAWAGTAVRLFYVGGKLSAFYNGSIDDLRVYNRSLSANEVKLLYENKTNVTHADATTAGDNWTVKVTPVDAYGLNGTGVFSNGVNITADTTPPAPSSPAEYPADPAAYAPGQSYQFNVTWTDNIGVLNIIIEHNFTGTSQNYSAGNNTNMFFYGITDLKAGYYAWRMIANDSAGNYNSTDQYTYTVNKNNTGTNLYLNGTEANITIIYSYGTNMTAITSAVNAVIYLNGTTANESSSTTAIHYNTILSAGHYNVTGVNPGNENYTGNYTTWWLMVSKASTTTRLYLNGTQANLTITNPEGFNASGVTSAGSSDIFLNGTLANTSIGLIAYYNSTLAAGIYNVTAVNTGSGNYNSSSETFWLTVNPAPSAEAEEMVGHRKRPAVKEEANVSAELPSGLVTSSLFSGEGQSRYIEINNSGKTRSIFNITLDGLTDFAVLDRNTITLGPGEIGRIRLDIYVKTTAKPGIYRGKAIIKGAAADEMISIVIEVKERKPLFDIRLNLAQDSKKAFIGGTIRENIDMSNIGLNGTPVDVEMTLEITDMDKKVVYGSSKETLAVTAESSITREHRLPSSMQPGKYMLLGRITYSGTSAEAYDTFEIMEEPHLEKAAPLKGINLLTRIVMLLAVSMAIAWMAVLKKRHPHIKDKKHKNV
ncbi:hypothetical protein COV19_01615, partial [Candidatus Woesearchaeota archaeon CG10_big_fil_rev_8_21_14_0_10_44_13]